MLQMHVSDCWPTAALVRARRARQVPSDKLSEKLWQSYAHLTGRNGAATSSDRPRVPTATLLPNMTAARPGSLAMGRPGAPGRKRPVRTPRVVDHFVAHHLPALCPQPTVSRRPWPLPWAAPERSWGAF